MSGVVPEEHVRAAALQWLSEVTFDGTIPVTRDQLSNDFAVGGQRFPLVDAGRGIRRPAGWSTALSILTAVPKGSRGPVYDDAEGLDGYHRYKLRRDAKGAAENDGLRVAMSRETPLIWFKGLAPSVYQAIFPVYLVAEEDELSQFVMALTEEQRRLWPTESRFEKNLRRYLMTTTRQRLHQPVFAYQVMRAYSTRCAVCSLGHRELLDAAHIIPDAEEGGVAVVNNGLALCKIHHAAYDRNILGIRSDYTVEIHHRLLEEIDGPMLRYGLQEHHDRPLMTIPRARAERPDPNRLQQRYEVFRST